MSSTNMPGFTAELSIYKTSEYFPTFGGFFHQGNSTVDMAQMFTPNPDGPIPTFPGVPPVPIPSPSPAFPDGPRVPRHIRCFRLCTNYDFICIGFPFIRCFRVCTNYERICF